MLRKSLTAVVSVFVVAFLVRGTSAHQAISLDEVLARHVAAKGGAEKLKTVQTIKQTGHFTSQGLRATIAIYSKRPNLIRIEILAAGKKMINGFDGTKAWLINQMAGSDEPTVLAGAEAATMKEQADFESPLMNHQAKGFKVELVGTETLNGKRVHHLKITSPTLQVQECYLDAATFLETKVVNVTPSGPLDQEFSDYRDVQGVMMPFAIRTFLAGTLTMDVTMEKIEVNVPVDDALFKVPGK